MLAAIAALLLLACAAWAFARSRAYEPHWLVSMRHAMAEAGFRTSATWAEFTDWAEGWADSPGGTLGPSKMRGPAAIFPSGSGGMMLGPSRQGARPMDTTTHPTAVEQSAPGAALSIERYFTSPDTHPFDTVQWERRDARIGHGDRVAFEQTDVEFPTTWSQNATNIVTQKYFRGQLGYARARALGQADDRPRRRHDRRLGARARLLRHRGRTATPSRPS